MKIIQASSEHLEILLPLFEGYRTFYKQPVNHEASRAFLTERLNKKDSVIFITVDEHNNGLGFTQLYPSFSSVSMQPTYILNNLFVATSARKKGVGEALMERAKQFTIAKNAKGLTLETEIDNPAQFLYERLGWEKNLDVFHYTWKA